MNMSMNFPNQLLNPWLDIDWCNTIARCDWLYFAREGARLHKDKECKQKLTELIERGNASFEEMTPVRHYDCTKCDPKLQGYVADFAKKYQIQFDTLPEPYTGDPDADVYILNMNPGEKDSVFEQLTFNRWKLLILTRLTLAHRMKYSMWYDLKGHNGHAWLMKITNQLLKIKPNPRFFMIEYFPYHTKKGFTFPTNLPSYKYTDELIKYGMRHNKFFIIMRNKKEWNTRIKCLSSYNNLFCIKNNQNPCLTKNNINKFNSYYSVVGLLNSF